MGWIECKESGMCKKILEFTIPELEQNKVYEYRIIDKDGKKQYAQNMFKSFPGMNESNNFTFIAISDVQIQERYAIFQHWFKSIISRNKPDFIINCGDIVSSLSELKLCTFFNMFKKVFSRIPVFSVIGNHDFGKNGIILREEYGFIPNKNERYYYWFNYGDTYFFMLSTNYLNVREEFKNQTNWLKKELEKVKYIAKNIIVCFHVPPYGPPYNPNKPEAMAEEEKILRENWIPIFEKYKVRLIISGHKHVYCRERRSGIWYVITGSFQGIRKYPVWEEDNKKCLNKHAIIQVSVEKTSIDIKAISLLGLTFDNYSIGL
jgi:predicted phosphodiesterase